MKTIFCILVFFAFGVTPFLRADVAPKDKLSMTIDQALDLIYGDCCRDLPMAEKESNVRTLVEENYDLVVMIRRSMGRNWSHLKEEEKGEVVDLIKTLIVRAFVQNLGDRSRPEVVYGEVIEISSKRIEIPTVITTEGQNYNVLYRLGKLRSGWQIYDIVAENISVVSNYRQQFDDHFRRSSGSELIQKLKKLLEKGKLDEEITL